MSGKETASLIFLAYSRKYASLAMVLSFLCSLRSEHRKESTIAREAYFLEYAKNIREAVSLPLMVTGGFRSKEGIENALQSNICQIVGVGRPLCADPHCIKKMIDGHQSFF